MNATSILHSTRSIIPFARPAPPARNLSRIAAQSLGFLSLLLGALEMAAPRRLATRVGIAGRERRHSYGGREIAAGIAALAGFLGPAMWVRAFGNLSDWATHAVGHRTERHTARNVTIMAVGGIAVVSVCAIALLAQRARH